MRYDRPDFDLTKRYYKQARKPESNVKYYLWTGFCVVCWVGVLVMVADSIIRNS